MAAQRTILSTVDYDLTATRPFSFDSRGGFNHTFQIPAVEKGEYKLLRVTDMHQQIHREKDVDYSVPVFADGEPQLGIPGIAADLIEEWTGGMVGPKPGVILLAGDEPTPADVQQALSLHQLYQENLRRDAFALWSEGNQKDACKIQYRRASIWLGFHTDPWLQAPRAVTQKPCPWCGKQVDSDVPVCAHCQKIVDMARFVQLEAEQEQIRSALSRPVPQIPVPQVQPTPKVQARA